MDISQLKPLKPIVKPELKNKPLSLKKPDVQVQKLSQTEIAKRAFLDSKNQKYNKLKKSSSVVSLEDNIQKLKSTMYPCIVCGSREIVFTFKQQQKNIFYNANVCNGECQNCGTVKVWDTNEQTAEISASNTIKSWNKLNDIPKLIEFLENLVITNNEKIRIMKSWMKK